MFAKAKSVSLTYFSMSVQIVPKGFLLPGAVCFAMIASSYVVASYDPNNVSRYFCNNNFRLTDGGLNEDAVDNKALNKPLLA